MYDSNVITKLSDDDKFLRFNPLEMCRDKYLRLK